MNTKEKYKISATDFLPEWEKHPTGDIDVNGKEICYGHAVKHNNEIHYVGYRYGYKALKQPFTMHTLSPSDWSKLEVTNTVGAFADYLIIGYNDEPFIQKLISLNLG